jgi:UPF0755 protein
MKKLLITIVVLVIVATIGGFIGYNWYKNKLNTPTSDSSQIVEIEIEQGEGVKDIAVKLQAAGVISSSDIFYFYIKFNNLGSKIQAGKFSIPQNLTIIEVANFIQKAAGNDLWITIPEGLRIDEIATNLDETFLKEENTSFDKDKFTDIVENPDSYEIDVDILKYKPEDVSLEGFLFPDTYNVPKDISALDLVVLFISTLEKKIEDNDLDLSDHKKLDEYEVLILASIIEREVRSQEQKKMVSDILQRRLDGDLDGVKLLQTDATLLYEEKDWKAVITNELKESDSLYNTYKVIGLPPTPICNSGMDSIEAVLDPEDNDYLYYLHDDQGKIHYAKTFDDHVNNQRCYINKNQDYCL